MSLDIGFDAQTPSLPQGGGAVNGLGETFSPDLSTGTGSYRIPLDLPNGPNDIGPRIAVIYGTASGNGPFGMGFSLTGVPRILRSTATGFPRFDATDTLMLEGVGELVSLGGGAYRPQVDAGAWRAEASGAGFRATDREGIKYFFGVNPAARLAGDGAGAVSIYAWHLERIEDALGNQASFAWLRDRNQLYPDSMAFGVYEVRFNWEDRPDLIRWGRAGFPVTTALRCSSIDLRLAGDAQPLLRRWTLTYSTDPANGCSLLSGVLMSGFAEDGSRLDAPALTLGYSAFQTRDLIRFSNTDDGAAPGPLTRAARRVDLVDWDADGLPDLIEVAAGGRARIWPNAGDCTWGRPQQMADLPLFSSPSAEVAFADMNGDGLADLLRLDQPISGYIPRSSENGFERPVTFSRAPAGKPSDLNNRLVDLDGDGIVDLLSSSQNNLSLFFRSEPDGWEARPRVIPRGVAPDVDLSDPHVFLADMTGDGSSDIVRADGGGVTYWPYLGEGRWADPVTPFNPPELPFDLNPHRLFLTDIDGDGCADIVYLDQGRVTYWLSRSGNSFSEPRSIQYVPTGDISDARLADMRGSGTAGILWSATNAFDRGTAYFYLDFSGDAKPYLLDRIDNGVGLTTAITYTTSAREAVADRLAAKPWSTALPIAIPVIGEVSSTDAATDRQSITRYRYHDGRYDGILREFAGFGRVDEDLAGDDSSGTQRTTYSFHIGVDPANPSARLSPDQRRSLRAIRGRLHKQERFGLDGSVVQHLPYDRLEQTWTVSSVNTTGGPVDIPRLATILRSTIERTAAPVATLRTENTAFDANSNVIDSVQTSEEPGHPERTQVLRTVTSFANDPAGRFLSRTFRVQQFDGSATIVADTTTEYDDQPEGQVGAQALVTRRTALVLTDELAAAIYPVNVPAFPALGYFRRPGENGWWVLQAAYQRTDTAAGLRGTVTSPRGAVTEFTFDANKTFPARITDARGNVIVANHNYRVSRIRQFTDAGGALYEAAFDALARRSAVIEPGDSAALPTHAWSYNTAVIPVEASLHQRAESGKAATIDMREIFDGEGKLLERRLRDEAGEIAVLSRLYSSRGFLARAHQEQRPASAAYSKPAGAAPHVRYSYDPLGRQTRQDNVDGTFRTSVYGPLVIEEADEEDTFTGAGALHSGTSTRKLLFGTGHVRALEQNLAGRLIVSSYEYDAKGNLTRHTDAAGNTVTFSYDLLGRTLKVIRPEHTSVSVFDAEGNAVEARSGIGTLAVREFDELKRPTAVRFLSAANPPVMRFTYQDAGFPAPLDAGVNTQGHLVRVDDESGSLVFDYDERGRVALKRSTPNGAGRSFDLRFACRADGQYTSITYPEGTVVDYQYNARGDVSVVPGVIGAVDYDLAGRRTRVTYANGTGANTAFDIPTGRFQSLVLNGPGGTLRQTSFTTDKVGNMLRVASPDPKLDSTYVYDDLYRLTSAATGSGEAFSYSYDDAANLTSKSGVGAYLYGEGGAPATCLTSAGAQKFTYTALGEMESTPWGVQTFDPMGRLIRIEADDLSARMEFVYDFAGLRVSARSSGSIAPAIDRLTPDALYSIESGVIVINFYDGNGICARRRSGDTIQFLHTGHLGSLVAVTDSAGALIDTMRYDPYGALEERTGAGDPQTAGYTGGAPDAFSGLLYLNARYYNPALGRFVSPDPVVQNALDPFAWAPYTYCRNNPTTFVDPSGRTFWGIFLAALAIVALIVVVVVCVVLDVFSFGTLTPALAIGIIALGSVVGGIVGGLAASAKGGNTDDIVTGIFVGAAVGGWAAFFSLFAGGAVAGAAHLSAGSFGSAVVAGFVNGAINGAAIGFASGFAGGKGSLDEILTKVWQGALVGAVTGAVIGGLANVITPPSKSLPAEVGDSLKTPPASAGSGVGGLGAPSVANSGSLTNLPSPYATSEAEAATKVGTAFAGKAGGAAGEWFARTVLSSPPLALIAGTVSVDLAAGTWDLGYVPYILDKIGIVKGGGKF